MFFIQSFLEKSLNRWVYRNLVFLQPFEFCTGLADIAYKVSKSGHFTPGFTLPILSCPSVLCSPPPTPKENAWKEPFRKDSVASATQERPPLFTQVVSLGGKDGLDEIICKYIKYQEKTSFGMGTPHETQAEHTLCIPHGYYCGEHGPEATWMTAGRTVLRAGSSGGIPTGPLWMSPGVLDSSVSWIPGSRFSPLCTVALHLFYS